jgi:hypothetical protein
MGNRKDKKKKKFWKYLYNKPKANGRNVVYIWRTGEIVFIKNPTKKQLRKWLDRVKKDILDTDESKRLDDAMDWNE